MGLSLKSLDPGRALGKITGKTAAKEEAAKARNDLQQGKTEALGYLDESYGTTQALNQPIADLYSQYLPQLQQQTAQGNQQAQWYINALSGMDPVLAIDHQQQVPGKREHSIDYDGLFYMFSSEATLAQFTANPERYAASVRQAMGIPRGRLVR